MSVNTGTACKERHQQPNAIQTPFPVVCTINVHINQVYLIKTYHTMSSKHHVQKDIAPFCVCMRIKNNFHFNSFTLSLTLKQKLGASQKWQIVVSKCGNISIH